MLIDRAIDVIDAINGCFLRCVGDFDVLQRGLEAAARGVVAREAEAELARYATEVEDRTVCSALLDALQV